MNDAQTVLKWFGVRTIVAVGDQLYEERITMWRRPNIDEAISAAEIESRDYASLLGDGCVYLGLAQAYDIGELTSFDGVEVFSLIRGSAMDPDAYLTAMFDTGQELQFAVDEEYAVAASETSTASSASVASGPPTRREVPDGAPDPPAGPDRAQTDDLPTTSVDG